MRRAVGVTVIVMLALAGCGADATDASAPNATPTETTSATPSPTPTATPSPTPAPQWLRVSSVVDGDTIKVETNGGMVETIRLIGLDTPETKKPGTPVQCFGQEASVYAKTLLEGQQVRIDQDSTQGATDKYGRTLAYVWLQDGRLVNEVMLAGGYGREYTYDKPYKYQTEFTAAQRQARDSKFGLWQSCVNTPKPAQPEPKPKPRVETGDPKPEPPAPRHEPEPQPPAPRPEPPAPKPEPKPEPKPDLDPRFDTCKEANAHGYGPYQQGVDPEYDWYQDRDHDGLVCER